MKMSDGDLLSKELVNKCTQDVKARVMAKIDKIKNQIEEAKTQKLIKALRDRTITEEDISRLSEILGLASKVIDAFFWECRNKAKLSPKAIRAEKNEQYLGEFSVCLFFGFPAVGVLSLYYGLHRLVGFAGVAGVLFAYVIVAISIAWKLHNLIENSLGPFPSWIKRDGWYGHTVLEAENTFATSLGEELYEFHYNKGILADIRELVKSERSRLHKEELAHRSRYNIAWKSVGKLTNAEHLFVVLDRATAIERALKSRFDLMSDRIHEMLDEVDTKKALPEWLIKKGRFVATIRNKLVHEYKFHEVEDLDSFVRQCHDVLNGISGDRTDFKYPIKYLLTAQLQPQLQFVVDLSKHIELILTERFGSTGGIGLLTVMDRKRYLHSNEVDCDIREIANVRNGVVHDHEPLSASAFAAFKGKARKLFEHLQELKPRDRYG